MLNIKDSLSSPDKETFGISPEEKLTTPHVLKRNITEDPRPKSTYVLPNSGNLLHG
jgi:hypothetical protein